MEVLAIRFQYDLAKNTVNKGARGVFSDFACILDDNLRHLGAHKELCKPKKL